MIKETTINQNTLVIKRTLNASIERVYKAWTDPVLMSKWFLPNERWDRTVVEANPVVGGKYRISMTHSDGDIVNLVGKFTEVVPNQKISFTWNSPEGEEQEEESILTIELCEVDHKTMLTLTHVNLVNEETRKQTLEGWNGCLDSLGVFVESSNSK